MPSRPRGNRRGPLGLLVLVGCPIARPRAATASSNRQQRP